MNQPATTQTALLLRLNRVQTIACDTFAEASKLFREYIEFNGLGASGMHPNAGVIYHPTKGEFAWVSYNGRVWKGTDRGWTNGKPDELTELNTNDYEN